MKDGNQKIKTGRKTAIIIFALLILMFSVLGIYFLVFNPSFIPPFNDKQTTTKNEEQIATEQAFSENCTGCLSRWLDGIMVQPGQAFAFPVAVAIDNDVAARPQSGLSSASLVYEVPVEGGMSRYLAIFTGDAEIGEVGPVRSARPYMVDIASELRALFVHCGGSQEALTGLKKSLAYDLNEFYDSGYFWRDKNKRLAPHNVFISADNWRRYLKQRGLDETRSEAWLFKSEGTGHASSSRDISLRYSANFQPLWRYMPEDNAYRRFFNGLEQDSDNLPVMAKNIIVHFVVSSQVLDDAGRLRLGLSGRGRALLCLDGRCRDAYWLKDGNSRSRYYYTENNEEAKLNPGPTWIEIIDEGGLLSY